MALTTLAVVSGVSVISGAVSAKKAGKAAEKAGELQFESTQAGQAETARQFDITEARLQEAQEFQREQVLPFQQAGVSALEQQQALLGLSGPEAQESAFAGIKESSGQQFLRRRQERALLRNASAIGGLGGGNVRTALQEQAVGFASQDIENQFGRLGQLSGQGQVAATNIGQGAITTAGNIGQFGAQATSNIANLGVAGAEARASGIFGKQQAEAQGLQEFFKSTGQLIGQFA